jgi:hypothetical protein
MRKSEAEAIADLKLFVAEYFDGSTVACLALDNLLWDVRLSKGHEPKMRPSAETPTLEDL